MDGLCVANLKLGKLADRTPVKLTIAVSPELSRALSDYARAHEEAYGQEESPAELVPAMLESFLAGDREALQLLVRGVGQPSRAVGIVAERHHAHLQHAGLARGQRRRRRGWKPQPDARRGRQHLDDETRCRHVGLDPG